MLSQVPENIVRKISTHFNVKAVDFSFVTGGCINSCGKMIMTDGSIFFIKWNKKAFPEMFRREKEGLELLAKQSLLKVPEVYWVEEIDDWSFIVMEFVEKGYESNEYWRNLGVGLAEMHRLTSKDFGLDNDNYVGAIPQINSFKSSWSDFFIANRLGPLVKKCIDEEKAPQNVAKQFEKLYPTFISLCNTNEPPALLHGDLWSGNVFATHHNQPALFDPAVYYGNREIELAFTKLFGGFSPLFYDTYEEIYPLESGFNERVDMYQLYPLLVHVLLFGGGYLNSVQGILKRYS